MDKLKVNVRSAIKLDVKSLKTLSKFIKDKYGKDSDIDVKIDRELIAGFKIMVEGTEYDYSLSGELNKLHEEL